MILTLSCALAVAWSQPPVEVPRTVEPGGEPSRLQPPVSTPRRTGPQGDALGGMMPGAGTPTPQFNTGAFPFGATMAIADQNGNLSIEVVLSEFVPETATRTVPFQGPDGSNQYRNELYTVMKPIFKSIKRMLPPSVNVFRGGRELTADEKRALSSPTPMFITTVGAPDRAPGQGYEALLRDALVAYVPAVETFMPQGPGMGTG